MTTGTQAQIKIELIFLGVTDIDRARDFYVDKVGFTLDYDRTVSDDLRFIQLTPVGSACSIAFGKGITDLKPGEQRGIQAVIEDADATHAELAGRGVDVSEIEDLAWGRFITFSDPDGNAWTLQQLPHYDTPPARRD